MPDHAANLRIDLDRLLWRLGELGKIGALEGGGVRRLALTAGLLCAFAVPAVAQDAAELAEQARRKKLERLKQLTPEQRREAIRIRQEHVQRRYRVF